MYYGKAWLKVGYIKENLVTLKYPIESEDIEQINLYRRYVECR